MSLYDAQSQSDFPVPQVIAPDGILLDPQPHPGLGRQKQLSTGIWNERRVIVKRLAIQSQAEKIARRAAQWHDLQHTNILDVYGISPQDEKPQYIILPLQENGNITQWTANSNMDLRPLVLDVAVGMQYLHAHGIVHGGLKPTNILISPDGRGCVADYDMLQVQPSRSPEAHHYYSPEAWKGTTSKPSDVFAFAMCALEVFTSTLPWGVLTEDRIYRLVTQENARPDRPDDSEVAMKGLDDKIWGIIEESWHGEARLRPSFEIIVKMWREHFVHEHSYSHSTQKLIESTFDDEQSTASPFLGGRYLVTRDSMRSYTTGPPAYHEFGAPADSESSSSVSSSAGTSSGRSGRSPSNSPPTPRTPPQTAMSLKQMPTKYPTLPPISSRWSLPTEVPSPSRQLSADSVAYHNLTRSQSAQTVPLSNRTPTNMNIPPAISPAVSIRSDSLRWHKPQRSLSASASLSIRSPYSPRPFSPKTLETIMDNATLDDGDRSLAGSRSTIGARLSPLLVIQALQSEVREGRKKESVDKYLLKMYEIAIESDEEAFKLVNAGAIPTLIHLLKTRAAEGYGVDLVLIILGTLAHDSISANTIFRTGTAATLVEICSIALNEEVENLAIWCLSRICRTAEVANGLIKLNLPSVLLRSQSRDSLGILPSMSMFCLGTLVQSDGLADYMGSVGLITVIATHLRRSSEVPSPSSENISAGLYAVARISRSIKLAKALAKAGCIEIIAHHLKTSMNPEVLNWSARAVGCLMRPNSSDMSKILLEADIAKGLARLPTVLPPEVVYPLGSFGFAIQRFSCAEWGGSTRKALVDAGVVDSLLAALRAASNEYCFDVHVQLALAISLLGDVGGSAIRKEIVNAGGIDILKNLSVGATGNPDVSKACNMAITSITGNVFSRNAATAKTAMLHDWNGGASDFHPPCPVTLSVPN